MQRPALDTLTQYGSGALAARLSRYWRNRGYPEVQFTRAAVPGSAYMMYEVRSNLINGLPPSVAAAATARQ